MKRSPPGKFSTALPGIHKVFRPLAAGGGRLHVYAARGGPSIAVFEADSKADALKQLRSPEGAARLAGAYAAQTRLPEKSDTLADILHLYEASSKFTRKSDSTKSRERGPLEEIRRSKMGSFPKKALASKNARSAIEDYRDEVGEQRGFRAADIRVGLISKALSWAVLKGLAPANPAYGIEHLHDSDRSDIIFLPKDLDAFEAEARARRKKNLKKGAAAPEDTPAIVLALLLVCFTGLRREDICLLTWKSVGKNVIQVKPLKSVRRARTSRRSRDARPANIPITPELRAVLNKCDPGDGKRGPWVLTSTNGGRFTPSGLTSSFIKVRDAANIVDEDGRKKRLHDARGTFVTNMRANGFSVDDIAEMVGWSKDEVDKIAKKYLDAEHIAVKRIERILKNDSGT
ncbi:MAG: tyrosine-type recombinase/integrase [Hyphomonadaceae bacterium]|nr:tyrosine-type recombinase/integrase [Hyphomonadaceae bacterium]